MNDLALLFDLFGNSEETKLLICTGIFVWCLQRHRNGGLNSGQKSAIIVTDALICLFFRDNTLVPTLYFRNKDLVQNCRSGAAPVASIE